MRHLRPTPPTIALAAVLGGLVAASLTPPVSAQERADTALFPIGDIEDPVSPGGAFLRALAVPGWGHASIGAYGRGGFYVLAEAGSLWMIVRSLRRRGAAEDRRELAEDAVRRRLGAEGVTDPAEIEAALEADEEVDDARDLVDARSQQFEDWLALEIFLVLVSGVDALVSAHLKDFPEPVGIRVAPVGERMEIGVTVPVRF